jgi:hypothetical protein
MLKLKTNPKKPKKLFTELVAAEDRVAVEKETAMVVEKAKAEDTDEVSETNK